jgi:ABC-type multidrug transport system fused ATPase/permease subunit
VALIDQEPKLFSRDIAANITYGFPDSTPEATAAAATQANAASFIDAFPEKCVCC